MLKNIIIVNDLIRFGKTNYTLNRIEALNRRYDVSFILAKDNLDTINKKEEFELMHMHYKCIKDSFRNSIRERRKFEKERLKR